MIAPPLGRLVHLLGLGLPAPVAGAHAGAGLVVVDQVQVLVALHPLLPARGPRPQLDRLSLAENAKNNDELGI